MRLPSIGQLAAVSGLAILSTALVAWVPFAMSPTADLSQEEAKAAVEYLRGCLERRKVAAPPSLLGDSRDAVVPVAMTVWRNGRPATMRQVVDRPLPEAMSHLARDLVDMAPRLDHPTTRIQIDFAMASGWVPKDGVLFSLSFVEGHDGVSGEVNGRRVYVTPSELIRARRYGSFKPLPGYDPRFKIGLAAERTKPLLASTAKALGIAEGEVTNLRRFASLSMVEGRDLAPRRLLKGTVARPKLDRAAAEASVIAGAQYLKRALGNDGVFRYQYDPLRDKSVGGSYNWPRHAGVAYSLALVGRSLNRPDLSEAAGRALARFEEQLVDGPEGSKCLLASGACYLGSSALGLLALSEYRIATGDDRFEDSAKRIASFLRHMQREDGTFNHQWYPDRGVDTELMKLYASQQAVMALGRHATAKGGDDAALEAAELGMDYLAGPYWDFFLGSYFYGQEHWSCLAAEELYSHLPKESYARYCHGIGVHYDAITHNSGDTPFAEDVGGMSITHMFTPGVGGTATAAEAMISAALLGRAQGLDTSSIERQIVDTLGFLVKGQLTDHDTFWTPRPEISVGAFMTSQSNPIVRIDTVQHAISAIVRGLDLLGPRTERAMDEALSNYSLAL